MTAALSGFCGINHPWESHERCTKPDCPCIHHRMPASEPVSMDLPAWCRCPDDCDCDGQLVPTNPVAGLQRAVDALSKAMPELIAQADDPEALGLALLLLEVREARTTLYGLEQDLEGITAKALMADDVQGEGVRVERYRSRDRKEWDHEQWQRDVRAKVLRKHGALKAAAVVTADGEPLDVNLYDLLADVQSVHGAGQPKTTALRQLGLDASEYCSTLPGTAHVRVIRLADETEVATDG